MISLFPRGPTGRRFVLFLAVAPAAFVTAFAASRFFGATVFFAAGLCVVFFALLFAFAGFFGLFTSFFGAFFLLFFLVAMR
jgi:hypothetical protein